MSHTVVLVGVVFGDIDIVEIGGLATLENTFKVFIMLWLSLFDMVGFARTHNALVKIITTDLKKLANFESLSCTVNMHQTELEYVSAINHGSMK